MTNNFENRNIKDRIFQMIKEYFIFFLIFIFYLFYPRSNRDYSFILLFFIVYVIVIFAYKKYDKLDNALIILYQLCSYFFTILHLNNVKYADIQISIYEYVDHARIGVWRYRILLPEIINFLRNIFFFKNITYDGFQIIIRFMSLSLAFLYTIKILSFLEEQLENKESPISKEQKKMEIILLPLLYIIFIPYSWKYNYLTDFVEIMFCTMFIYFMLKKELIKASLTFLIATLNRDSIVFYLIFFCLYYLIEGITLKPFKIKRIFNLIWKNSKKNKLVIFTVIFLGIMVILQKFILILIYGLDDLFENHYEINMLFFINYLNNLIYFKNSDIYKQFARLVIFIGGTYILIFLFLNRIKTDFLISFVIMSLVWLPVYFIFSMINETRVLFNLFPSIIICFYYILFNKDVNEKNLESQNFIEKRNF